jgi:hypothetical protein
VGCVGDKACAFPVVRNKLCVFHLRDIAFPFGIDPKNVSSALDYKIVRRVSRKKKKFSN